MWTIWTKLGVVGICVGMILLAALRLYDNGYSAGEESAQAKIAAANKKADDAQLHAQQLSDQLASTKNGATDAKISAINANVNKLLHNQSVAAAKAPLPKDCIFDQGRIDETNGALIQ